MDLEFMFCKPTFPNVHFHRLKSSFFNLSFFFPFSLSLFILLSLFLYFSHSFFFVTIYFTFDQVPGLKHIMVQTHPRVVRYPFFKLFLSPEVSVVYTCLPRVENQNIFKNHLSVILTSNKRHNFKRGQYLGHNHLLCFSSLGATPDRRSSEDGGTQEI